MNHSSVTRTLLAVGETMALVTPSSAQSLSDAERFRLDVGGAESNVAAHIAALGHEAHWFSRLGRDALGDRVLSQLTARGIRVDRVIRDAAHPTGVYVKNPGHGVLYYRSGSAAAQLAPDDADQLALDGVDVLHLSGITAALSETAAQFVDRVIDRAHAASVIVSFDVNYRPVLWSNGTAAPVLAALARRSDVVFAGRDEAELLWGTTTADEIRELLRDVPELVVKDGESGRLRT